METTTAPPSSKQITPPADVNGLRLSVIFPQGREPSSHEWTKQRWIPYCRLGHFVFYSIEEVAEHIRTMLIVPARG
jgi:hypothetical protein